MGGLRNFRGGGLSNFRGVCGNFRGGENFFLGGAGSEKIQGG